MTEISCKLHTLTRQVISHVFRFLVIGFIISCTDVLLLLAMTFVYTLYLKNWKLKMQDLLFCFPMLMK